MFCFSSSCVPYVAIFSGLSFFWLPLRYSRTLILCEQIYWCWKDTEGVFRSCKLTKDRQYNWENEKRQNVKQWSTKRYTENKRLINTNPTKNPGWSHVLRKDTQFLLNESYSILIVAMMTHSLVHVWSVVVYRGMDNLLA